MNYRDYTEILKGQTSVQEYEPALRFSILICKKLYFDYNKFTEVENWGDADLLMDAIHACEQALQNSIDIYRIKDLLHQIDSITPDTEDFGSELGSYALNACSAVYETLEFILDKDNTHIYNIATYYTDTIDFKIQEENPLTELEIENHPVMVEAWNFVIDQTNPGI